MIWNFLSRFYLRALYLSYHKWYHDGGETDNYTETTLDSGNLTFFFLIYLLLKLAHIIYVV